MVIAPNSKIILIKNPLKLDSNNEIMFSSKNAQETYFQNLPKLEFNNLTYVRNEGILRVPTDETGVGLTYEDLLGYNFCMYQNTHFSNKWFYAFITEVTWINPGMTEMKLETAYYQTWQFDLIYKDSFIEREHVNNDTIGLHTIPENLETGEYIIQNLSNTDDVGFNYMNNCHYVVALSEWVFDAAQPPSSHLYNGVFSGFRYLAFNSAQDVTYFIDDLQDETSSDVIYGIFIVPSSLTELRNTDFQTMVTGALWKAAWVVESVSQKFMGDFVISDIKIIDQDFVPVNNKVLCYPYRYLLVNNNCGSSESYRYEWFYNKPIENNKEKCYLTCYGVISQGCSVKLYPRDYNKNSNMQDSNYLYGIDGGKLPTCSWWNDGYTNWLTQNAINIPLQTLGNATNLIQGVATKNPSTMISGISGVANQVSQLYEHSLEPKTGKGGVNQGDLNYSSKIAYNVYRMSIRKEYAQTIDNYFSMFGYKVNRLGMPHLHVRTYYDYIKTIDINIEGDIPEQDLNKIREMFNNGIRFWHTTTDYLNFSVNNSII